MKVCLRRPASPDRQSIMDGISPSVFRTEKLYMSMKLRNTKQEIEGVLREWQKPEKYVWHELSPWDPPGCWESKEKWPGARWPCPGSSNAAGTTSCWWSSPSPAPRCSAPCSSLRRGKRGRSLRRRRGGWFAGSGRPNFGWSSRSRIAADCSPPTSLQLWKCEPVSIQRNQRY